MRAVPGLADRAATLLEADPRLVRTLGRRDAATLADRPILPVLSVRPGSWTAPEPASLGVDTLALSVLDGILVTAGNGLVGPGDFIAPWGSRWIVCTPTRLAVIGRNYLEALQPWSGVAADVRSRAAEPRTAVSCGRGPLEERVLELLWRVASRWGELRGTGVSLPPALDLPALCRILDVGELELTLAFARLREDGIGVTAGGALWLPARREQSARRDELRARAAVQLALTRVAVADCAALCEELDLTVQRGGDLRAARPGRRRAPRSPSGV